MVAKGVELIDEKWLATTIRDDSDNDNDDDSDNDEYDADDDDADDDADDDDNNDDAVIWDLSALVVLKLHCSRLLKVFEDCCLLNIIRRIIKYKKTSLFSYLL